MVQLVPDSVCQGQKIDVYRSDCDDKSTITVIPKKGKLSNPSNWRPITQTSIFAKILEKLVHKRLLSFFDDNHILTKYQYGFCPNKSTQQAIIDLIKFVHSGLNNKKLISCICLDVCKAFDCINHDILLYKLHSIGCTNSTLTWFKSYLTRTQAVRYNNVLSDVLKIKTGIGQGTILGPLILIFYINDIIVRTGRLKINMYADDCILFASGNNWNIMKDIIQPDLDGIQSWCNHNRLTLSISKSKTLLLGSISKIKKVDLTEKLVLNNVELDFVEKYTYLGVVLDRYMSLTGLVSSVKKNVVSQLFKLRKIGRMITVKCAIDIYKQTILPILDYAGFMLYSINQSDKNDLQILQNDALRTCYNVQRRDRLSVKNLHTQAKLLSLDQRRQIQLLSLMYTHKCSVNPVRVNARLTRGADRYRFYTERCNSTKYRNSPYYRGSNLWDLLLKSTIECDSLFEFKRTMKKVEINTYKAQQTI